VNEWVILNYTCTKFTKLGHACSLLEIGCKKFWTTRMKEMLHIDFSIIIIAKIEKNDG
jgi:hypothetical protein